MRYSLHAFLVALTVITVAIGTSETWYRWRVDHEKKGTNVCIGALCDGPLIDAQPYVVTRPLPTSGTEVMLGYQSGYSYTTPSFQNNVIGWPICDGPRPSPYVHCASGEYGNEWVVNDTPRRWRR